MKQVASASQATLQPADKYRLSTQAAEVLAKEGPSTPREILAALVNLEFHSRQNGRAADATLVRAQLKSAQSPMDRSLARIAKAVAEAFDVPVAQLRSTARLKSSVLPRKSRCFWLAN